jgi:chorismate mutase
MPELCCIDIDQRLVRFLHNRFQVVEKVGIFKESIGMPPMQETQWQKVVKTRKEWAREI